MNKKKKLAIVITSALLVAALAVGMTLAYFTSSDTKENVLTLGKINVALEEKMADPANPDKEIEYKDPTNVKPGELISKIPYIINQEDSNTCYVRAKVTIESPEGVVPTLDISDITFDGDWSIVPIAGTTNSWYCYRSTTLDPGESARVFTTVKIPDKWGNEVAEKQVKVIVTGEAIQADNFTPKMENGKITAWMYEDGTEVDMKDASK